MDPLTTHPIIATRQILLPKRIGIDWYSYLPEGIPNWYFRLGLPATVRVVRKWTFINRDFHFGHLDAFDGWMVAELAPSVQGVFRLVEHV